MVCVLRGEKGFTAMTLGYILLFLLGSIGHSVYLVFNPHLVPKKYKTVKKADSEDNDVENPVPRKNGEVSIVMSKADSPAIHPMVGEQSEYNPFVASSPSSKPLSLTSAEKVSGIPGKPVRKEKPATNAFAALFKKPRMSRKSSLEKIDNNEFTAEDLKRLRELKTLDDVKPQRISSPRFSRLADLPLRHNISISESRFD